MNHILLQGVVVVMSMSIVGCATNGGQPMTSQQKIAACGGMVLGGAVLGALVGGNKKSTAIGAGVGGAGCAVWLAFNNEKDKERIAALQAEAAKTGETQTETWKGDDNKTRKVTVSPAAPTEVAMNTPQGAQPCRMLNTTATLENRSDQSGEMWCRSPDGSWAARTTQEVAS